MELAAKQCFRRHNLQITAQWLLTGHTVTMNIESWLHTQMEPDLFLKYINPLYPATLLPNAGEGENPSEPSLSKQAQWDKIPSRSNLCISTTIICHFNLIATRPMSPNLNSCCAGIIWITVPSRSPLCTIIQVPKIVGKGWAGNWNSEQLALQATNELWHKHRSALQICFKEIVRACAV